MKLTTKATNDKRSARQHIKTHTHAQLKRILSNVAHICQPRNENKTHTHIHSEAKDSRNFSIVIHTSDSMLLSDVCECVCVAYTHAEQTNTSAATATNKHKIHAVAPCYFHTIQCEFFFFHFTHSWISFDC